MTTRTHDHRPDVFTFSSVISACSSLSSVDHHSYPFHPSTSSHNANNNNHGPVLHGPASSLQWKRALRLFKDMQKMKIEANLVAYTSLLTILQRAGQIDIALQVHVHVYMKPAVILLPLSRFISSSNLSYANSIHITHPPHPAGVL